MGCFSERRERRYDEHLHKGNYGACQHATMKAIFGAAAGRGSLVPRNDTGWFVVTGTLVLWGCDDGFRKTKPRGRCRQNVLHTLAPIWRWGLKLKRKNMVPRDVAKLGAEEIGNVSSVPIPGPSQCHPSTEHCNFHVTIPVFSPFGPFQHVRRDFWGTWKVRYFYPRGVSHTTVAQIPSACSP